ncbi:hypothetical protein CCR75_006757 [Bremia lactucae]|uniref:Ras GTPase-activating protein-binding protein 1 n=1 Tax=Bremia lactucae TaxID=4779 RepID=A0A976IB95_BRELC|nr:hypothetical protein CCR75_006757 [Bremia lactucae]
MPETSTPVAHADEKAPSPSTVGNTFMRQYYHFLAKEPQSLHRFYKAESRWCHGVGSHMEEPIAGQRAINDQILKRGYAGARVDLDAGSIDCQNSQGDGVLVLVTGVMTLRESPTPKPFVQTFFLAVQPKGYFVLNDCLRFLEFPGVSSYEVAVVGTKNGHKTATVLPPVKKVTAAIPVSPKTSSSLPVKTANLTTTVNSLPNETASASPMKIPATTAASSPIKNSIEKVTAVAGKAPSPGESTEEVPTRQNKTPISTARPTSTIAPADPVVPVHAEPERPKSWAALFAASKTTMAVSSMATSVAASGKPTTPKIVVALASSPSSASANPSTSSPRIQKSPKNKASNGKEKEHKRLYSLFIRDVPAQTRENDLRELFQGYGSIAGVGVVAQRGFAFVDYHEQGSMRAALAETKEFKVFDKVLQVDERAERKEGQRSSLRGNDARGRGRGFNKGGRGERKEQNGDEAPYSTKSEQQFSRRVKTGNRRSGKVDASVNDRAE